VERTFPQLNVATDKLLSHRLLVIHKIFIGISRRTGIGCFFGDGGPIVSNMPPDDIFKRHQERLAAEKRAKADTEALARAGQQDQVTRHMALITEWNRLAHGILDHYAGERLSWVQKNGYDIKHSFIQDGSGLFTGTIRAVGLRLFFGKQVAQVLGFKEPPYRAPFELRFDPTESPGFKVTRLSERGSNEMGDFRVPLESGQLDSIFDTWVEQSLQEESGEER
jgi:hypothetical protein